MTLPAVRADLDQMVCGCGRTTHDHEIAMVQRCHPRAPTKTTYRDGVITVWCERCNATIVRIAVASYLLEPIS